MRDKNLNKAPHWSSKPSLWLLLIVVSALIARLYHITYPPYDLHWFRQTQTAGLIRDWYRSDINMLYPTILSLGKPGYLVLEFPLYQAISAILYRLIAPDLIVARVFTIITGLVSIFFVYRISCRFLDRKSSVMAAFFFAFMPLDIFFQRVPMQDPFTVLFSLIMLYCLIEGVAGKRIYLLFATLAASLGLMMKSPYVAPLFSPFFYLLWKGRGKPGAAASKLELAGVFAVSAAAMIVWQHHSNFVNDIYCNKDTYPFKDIYPTLVVKLHPFNTWYFGTIAQRLNPANYLTIIHRLAIEALTPAGIILFVIGSIHLARQRRDKKAFAFFSIWLFSLCLVVMITFNLYIVHDYYLLPFCPALSIFCGAGAGSLLDSAEKRGKPAAAAFLVIMAVAFLVPGFSTAKGFFHNDVLAAEIGQFVEDHTDKDAMVAIVSPMRELYDPTMLCFADRHGFVIPADKMNAEMLNYFVRQDIKYLAVVKAQGLDYMPGKVALMKIYDISSGKPVQQAEGWKFL